jgi:hypothetical protein
MQVQTEQPNMKKKLRATDRKHDNGSCMYSQFFKYPVGRRLGLLVG